MPITWPKIPKLSDVIAVVDTLVPRLDALEAYVVRNDNRISALEAYFAGVAAERAARIEHLEAELAAHQVGAVERQADLDLLKRKVGRMILRR